MSQMSDGIDLLNAGWPLADVRSELAERYGRPAAWQVIKNLRLRGLIPARAQKMTRLEVRCSAAVQRRVRTIADDLDILPSQVARRAFLAGLGALERASS